MYVQVGSYPTPNNSSWHIIRAKTHLSPRGRIILRSEVWEIHTVLKAANQAALTTLIGEHIAGMSQNNVDMAFYEDDGTLTAHQVVNANTVNGITYLGHSFPGYLRGQWGSGSEYAEGGAFRYVVTTHTADILDVEDGLLFYQQSMQFSLGGVGYVVAEALNGPPQVQFTKQQTKFWGVQQGMSIGMNGYTSVPLPLVAAPPKPERSSVTLMTPRNFGRLVNWGFPMRWQYVYESPAPLNATPPVNP